MISSKAFKFLFLLFTAVFAADEQNAPKSGIQSNFPSQKTVKKYACVAGVAAIVGAYAYSKCYNFYTNYDNSHTMGDICAINQNNATHASFLAQNSGPYGQENVAFAIIGGACSRVNYASVTSALKETCAGIYNKTVRNQTVRQWLKEKKCSEGHALLEKNFARSQSELKLLKKEKQEVQAAAFEKELLENDVNWKCDESTYPGSNGCCNFHGGGIGCPKNCDTRSIHVIDGNNMTCECSGCEFHF